MRIKIQSKKNIPPFPDTLAPACIGDCLHVPGDWGKKEKNLPVSGPGAERIG